MAGHDSLALGYIKAFALKDPTVSRRTQIDILGFGNEEYSEVRKDIVSVVRDRMILLDEQSHVLESNGLRVGIVGTQGSLDKATSWQRRNIPSVKGVYERRAKRAALLLKKIKNNKERYPFLINKSFGLILNMTGKIE